jgi:phosphoenolpyruvate-protein kinase (PTS system EI component)
VRGFPYFPGVARGRLQRPGSGPGAIELVDQASLAACSDQAAGFIVVDGAPFSHPLIGLRMRGVPIVLVDRATAARLPEDAFLEIDGATGEILTTPEGRAPGIEPRIAAGHARVTTADGLPVSLRASIRGAAGAVAARELGADAIGLVRSEFLGPAMGVEPPDEPVFSRELRAVCEAAAPLAVNVRLLDIAPDKRPGWLPAIPGADSPLGLQGARLFEVSPVREVVEAELAALARLARTFDLGVIIPYVTQGSELAYWAEQVRAAVPGAARVMAMAETPAAVLEIRAWLDQVDAVSIGCNDLMQCLFAADRDLAPLHAYLDPYEPVLYRFLHMAATDAGEELARVQLCGLLPQLPGILPVLIGLGFRSFSVDPKILPFLQDSVRRIRQEATAEMAAAVLAAPDAGTVAALLRPHTSENH